MKWLARIGIALGVLALLLAVVLWWLLGTSNGLNFVLQRAMAATDGKLAVQTAQGRLAGPLTVEGLRYSDGEGTDVEVRRARIDVAVWPLLRRTLRIDDVEVRGITVDLPPASDDEDEEPGELSLEPPLNIVLQRLRVDELDVRQSGESLFAADSIDLGGAWTSDGIRIDQLKLRSPDGHADARGQVQMGTRYQGEGKIDFAWQLDERPIAGTLDTHGDGASAEASLILEQPLPLTLALKLQQGGDYPWEMQLSLPPSDATSLLGDGDIRSLAADLNASGTRTSGQLDGRVQIDDWPVDIKALRFALSDDHGTLDIQELKLASSRIAGALEARGRVALDADPLAADLKLAWQGVELPAELVGQQLDSSGSIDVTGDLAGYQATGRMKLGPPGQLADVTLDLQGDDQQLELRGLALEHGQSKVQIRGKVTFSPELGWDIEGIGRQFDPGQLLAGWDGALDFDFASQGRDRQGLDVDLDLSRLSGRLRGRDVHGKGRLHLSPEERLDGQLNLAMGQSRVGLRADPGEGNDIHVDLDVASLGDWLPDAAGSLRGTLRLRGELDHLALTAALEGRALRLEDNRIGTLKLDADVPDLASPGGRVEAEAGELLVAGLGFDKAELDANGTAARHGLTLDASGPQLNLKLALDGRMPASVWQGQLTRLDLEPAGMPVWQLEGDVPIRAGDGEFELGELCLTPGEPHVCAQAQRNKAGVLDASYSVRALPLQLVSALLPEQSVPITVEGVLDGQGTVRMLASGQMSGQAELHSDQGSITWLDSPDEPLFGWSALRLNADMDGDRQNVEIHSLLTDQGTVDGRVEIRGPAHALDGQVDIALDSLAFAALLSPDLANVQGNLQAQFQLGGNVAEPALVGQARVSGFGVELPAAGIKLADGDIRVHTRDAHTLVLEGKVHSGEGELHLGGELGLGDDAATRITVKGSQFTAADIPAARVAVSPDLAIEQSAQGVRVSGSLAIDRADIDVAKLPGGGATEASPDVVIMDEPEKEGADALPISAEVAVSLGEHTRLKGFGLEGKLAGHLVVRQRPGSAATGQGQIQVDGTYHAYGQDLTIERGQLLFASTPVDNPGLDIRAVRSLSPNATIDEGQKVGLQISGTATRPLLTVFSNPVMSQSDALSYLVTGKPLSQVNGGEGDMVGAAAQALGSATGDLLAKSIGNKLGIDDIGVSSNQALGGNAAFTVGKYLSPRLYLNYGVGLFEPGTVVTLRYLLNTRWNFEAMQATDFSRASFNYRYEK